MTALLVAGRVDGAAAPLGWIAFDDLRGQVETCGCSAATDYGGLARLSAFTERLREVVPGVAVYSLGAALAGPKHPSVPIVAKFLKEMRVTAILGRVPLPGTVAKHWVFSNVKEPQGNVPGVFGYISPRIEPTAWEVKTWLANLESSATPKVLLFRGPDSELQELVDSRRFDTIIAANTARADATVDGSQVRDPFQLVRIGKIWSVPLSGSGVLVSDLRWVEWFLPLSVRLGGPTGGLAVTSALLAPAQAPVVFLDRRFEKPSRFQPHLDRYFAELRAQAQAQLSSPQQPAAGYAGSDVCAGCHPGSYATWKSSAHSRAYETLVQAGKSQQLSCLECHVVGLGAADGFRDPARDTHLAGVGCEVCHGPRQAHVLDPASHRRQGLAVACTSCHHPPHVAQFVMGEKWPKIAHGQETTAGTASPDTVPGL